MVGGFGYLQELLTSVDVVEKNQGCHLVFAVIILVAWGGGEPFALPGPESGKSDWPPTQMEFSSFWCANHPGDKQTQNL